MKTIDAGELRIGNKLVINGKIITVLGFLKESVLYRNVESPCRSYLNLFEPIPLTEDILLKCGFVRTNPFNCFLHEENRFEIMAFPVNVFEFLNHDWPIQIKYLHQLQNLYFALTNQELQINFDM